jgi:hypothetical protein
MTQQPPPGDGSAFERSGALTPAIVAVVWAVIEWLEVLAAPSAIRTYRDAGADRTPASEIVTAYDLLGVPFIFVGIAAFVLTGIWLARARRNTDRIAPDQIHVVRTVSQAQDALADAAPPSPW